MEVKTYEQLIRYLEKEAANHIAYYHYTRWECLAKMMSVNSCGNGARHKFLLLTRAAKTNDGIEEKTLYSDGCRVPKVQSSRGKDDDKLEDMGSSFSDDSERSVV